MRLVPLLLFAITSLAHNAAVRLDGGVFRASLWSGTVGSRLDLTPSGASQAVIFDMHEGQQVGWAILSGTNTYRASLWSNTSGSWVDLHKFAKGFANSVAYGIWHDATYTYVVGHGYNNATARQEALMWRKRR